MWGGRVVLGALVAVLACAPACSGDDPPTAGWAIVKVEISDGPGLASICMDSGCREFDPASDVRSGEFAAFVEAGTEFEVLQGDAGTGEGARGPAPVGGCVLVELTRDGGNFVLGCGVPLDAG